MLNVIYLIIIILYIQINECWTKETKSNSLYQSISNQTSKMAQLVKGLPPSLRT